MQVGPSWIPLPLWRPRKPLTRRTAMKRTAIVPKPPKGPYGGPIDPAVAADYTGFKEAVHTRDGFLCRLCQNPTCLPLTVAHLQKVKMGGRRTSSVNHLETCVTLGLRCHRREEEHREITAQLLAEQQVMYPDWPGW